MILADIPSGNQPRKVIMQAPKNGFFYVLDRADGKLISGDPFAFTSWASAIDMQTGRPIETESARYRYNAGAAVAVAGRRASLAADGLQPDDRWSTTPARKRSMVVAMEESMNTRKAGGISACAWVPRNCKAPAPPPPIRKRRRWAGFFVAWDPVLKKAAWRIPFQSSGGALSTAGS